MRTKVCSKCKEEKTITEFNKNKTKKDGYQSYCRDCSNGKLKEHYEKNKDSYANKRDTRREMLREFINSIKIESSCKHCGEDDIACLDFHHTDDISKEFNVGEAINRGLNIDRIKSEINKCEILCSNCHRKLHYYGKL